MPLASASFQPAGEEELELLLAPGTVTGFKGVQEVQSGYYQAKLRNGRSFMSLPSSSSVLVAAWLYAKAFKARQRMLKERAWRGPGWAGRVTRRTRQAPSF